MVGKFTLNKVKVICGACSRAWQEDDDKKEKYHQFHSYVSTKVHVADQETIHYWHQEFKSELLPIAVGQGKKIPNEEEKHMIEEETTDKDEDGERG